MIAASGAIPIWEEGDERSDEAADFSRPLLQPPKIEVVFGVDGDTTRNALGFGAGN